MGMNAGRMALFDDINNQIREIGDFINGDGDYSMVRFFDEHTTEEVDAYLVKLSKLIYQSDFYKKCYDTLDACKERKELLLEREPLEKELFG